MIKRYLKSILNLIKSKSFIGSVVFAIALWIYTTLSWEFTTWVKLPVNVIIPQNKAFETQLPDKISVEVKGIGWQLFNLMFFNSSAKCQLDLSQQKFPDNIYVASRNDLIKNIQFISNLQALDVDPQTIDVRTANVGEYSVQIIPDVKINTREGFVQVGNISVKPDLINIRGNNRIVNNISTWKTENIILNDIFEPVSKIVSLNDTMKGIVELAHDKVRLEADIQRMTEVTVYDIKVNIDNKDLLKTHIIYPERVHITLRGGLNQIEMLDYKLIKAELSSNVLENDSTGIIQPIIKVPGNIKIIKIDPEYLVHKRIVKNLSQKY